MNKKCINCGRIIRYEAKFCTICGAKQPVITETPPPPPPPAAPNPKNEKPKTEKKKKNTGTKIAAIIPTVLLLAVVIVLGVLFTSGKLSFKPEENVTVTVFVEKENTAAVSEEESLTETPSEAETEISTIQPAYEFGTEFFDPSPDNGVVQAKPTVPSTTKASSSSGSSGSGKSYSKGTYSNGVYRNEWLGFKVELPSDFPKKNDLDSETAYVDEGFFDECFVLSSTYPPRVFIVGFVNNDDGISAKKAAEDFSGGNPFTRQIAGKEYWCVSGLNSSVIACRIVDGKIVYIAVVAGTLDESYNILDSFQAI
ncbi:MAG: zinc ribbon domain-containing protein [Clostridia bacterium]|nr:zinc ribbon domain-containing protein [Clostridia bacterium]